MGSEFIATFRAGPKTRRSEIASVVIYCFLLMLLLAVATFLLLDIHWNIDIRNKPGYLWLVVGLPLMVSFALAWFWGRRRFVFFVGLTPTHLQVGEKRGRQIPYDKLEMISLNVFRGETSSSSSSDSMIEFRSKEFRARACIEPEDRRKCANLLAPRCPNVLLVDEMGQALHSVYMADTQKAAFLAATHNRKRGWSAVLSAVALALLLTLRLYSHHTGESLDVMDWIWIVVCGAGLALSPWVAARYFRKARCLAQMSENDPSHEG